MVANINGDELRLLTYLHEHAEGFGDRFRFDPAKLTGDLEIDFSTLCRHLSYLEEHRLAGMNTIDTSRRRDGPPVPFSRDMLSDGFRRRLYA